MVVFLTCPRDPIPLWPDDLGVQSHFHHGSDYPQKVIGSLGLVDDDNYPLWWMEGAAGGLHLPETKKPYEIKGRYEWKLQMEFPNHLLDNESMVENAGKWHY